MERENVDDSRGATRDAWAHALQEVFYFMNVFQKGGRLISAQDILRVIAVDKADRFSFVPHDAYKITICKTEFMNGEFHPQNMNYHIISRMPQESGRPLLQYIARHPAESRPENRDAIYNLSDTADLSCPFSRPYSPSLSHIHLYGDLNQLHTNSHSSCVLYLSWLLGLDDDRKSQQRQRHVRAALAWIGEMLICDCECMGMLDPIRQFWESRVFCCHGQVIILFHTLIYYEPPSMLGIRTKDWAKWAVGC